MPEMSTKPELSTIDPAQRAAELAFDPQGPWRKKDGSVFPNVRQPTKENFPNLSEKELAQLKKDYPKDVWGEAGGESGQDLLLQMMQAMQSEEPLEVTELTARMHGIQLALAYRYGETGKGIELAADHLMLLPGLPEITKFSGLATLQQIVTTSSVPAQYKGDRLLKGPDDKLAIAARGVLSPPQLVRELRINDLERGDSFAMAPLLPEKLEKFSRAIQSQQLGAPRRYSPAELEATRRQTSAYFAMLNLQPGLVGSLSNHDILALRAFKDRIVSGAHDEAPMMQTIGLVPQVHAALAADGIEPLANLYTAHLTETRIFHAMRTFGVSVAMQVFTESGERVEVSGTVAMGDFMDQLLSSQDQLERIMQAITDAGPRQAIRGLQSMNEEKPGVVVEEGDLIWKVLGQRLGMFNNHHQWVSLHNILFEGCDSASTTRAQIAQLIENRVLRTNLPDIEVMMPLTQGSLGVYPMDENIAGAMYPLYLSAREFSRALLLDMMMTPDFQGKAGKAVRKLRRWDYDVWLYWQGRTGLNELQKTFPYKDFLSERVIPKLIDQINITEVPNWKQALRSEIENQGEVWLEAFDNYSSYTALAKDVIATTLTNSTLLASRAPKVEGYITALALNTSSTTRREKISVYQVQLQKDMKKGLIGSEDLNRRTREFEIFLDYWSDSGPLRGEYESDIQRRVIPRSYQLEDWLKYKIRNELYASRSQRPGTLKTKEEMLAAVDMLTPAERACLNLTMPVAGHYPARHAVSFEGIAKDMGLTFTHNEGYAGAREFIKRFSWRNFPINAIPPRLADGTSVGGYFTDFVKMTDDTAHFCDTLGERKAAEKLTALPTVAENIDTGQMIGITDKAADYILATYHFVPFAAQRERALEAAKIILWATTPLKSDELVVATMRTVGGGGGGTAKPMHQEIFIPIGLFGPQERAWLKATGMRGSSKGGEEGMIFLGDFPARFRLQFGNIKDGFFEDMRDMAKECHQPLTVVGMERPNYNTVPWFKMLRTLSLKLRQGSMLAEKDMKELEKFANEHFDPRHKEVSETTLQKTDRNAQDILEIAQGLFNLLSSLLSGGK